MRPAASPTLTATRQVELTRSEALARTLDKPLGVLGLVFLFVVLGQLLASGPLLSALNILSWLFWLIFVGEFVLRAYVARFQLAFWKKNWWQVIFLLVPFLRFFRALRVLRLTRLARFSRLGSVVTAGVRGSRSAGRLLSSRIGWLIAITAVVTLSSSQLLYAMGYYTNYGDALYELAMATITGEGLTPDDGFTRILRVLLAVYSVVVFASLAGSLGAYFLREQTPKAP